LIVVIFLVFVFNTLCKKWDADIVVEGMAAEVVVVIL